MAANFASKAESRGSHDGTLTRSIQHEINPDGTQHYAAEVAWKVECGGNIPQLQRCSRTSDSQLQGDAQESLVSGARHWWIAEHQAHCAACAAVLLKQSYSSSPSTMTV
eukprot:scpid105278/ scgid32806/ 